MKSNKIWTKYWKDIFNLTEEETKFIFNDNPTGAFVPLFINNRKVDTTNYLQPIIAITLPRRGKKPDTFVLIGEFCRTFINGRCERFEKMLCFDHLNGLLMHHRNMLEQLNDECRNEDPSKYFMSIIYMGSHYVIPLTTDKRNKSAIELVERAMSFAKIVFKDLLEWVKQCKSGFDMNDVDEPLEKYKKDNGINDDVFDF